MSWVSAIVFDLDGTLCDARELHFQALNDALATAGHEPIDRGRHDREFDGLPTRTKLERLGLGPEKAALVQRLKQERTIALVESLIAPRPQVTATIQALSSRYPLACVSNAVRETVERMLRRAGIMGFFQTVLSNEDVPIPKPDPGIYISACERLGVLPERTLAVEDNLNGQIAAIRAGCRLCPVRDPNDVSTAYIQEAIEAHEKQQLKAES